MPIKNAFLRFATALVASAAFFVPAASALQMVPVTAACTPHRAEIEALYGSLEDVMLEGPNSTGASFAIMANDRFMVFLILHPSVGYCILMELEKEVQ